MFYICTISIKQKNIIIIRLDKIEYVDFFVSMETAD